MTKQFKKGDVIFREGEIGDTLYQTENGTVSIYAAYEEKEQQLLTQLPSQKCHAQKSAAT